MCKALCKATVYYGNAAYVVSVLFEELFIIDYVALKKIVVYYLPLLCPGDMVKNVLRIQIPPLVAEGSLLIMHQIQMLSMWLIKT